MQSPWAKAAAVLIGVFLLLFAVSMLMEGSGIVQTGRNSALAYLIGLLGLGLIAAAFFGDNLKYAGDGKGPLGKVIATGGAAVFVIGLIFILSVGDERAQADGPVPSPTASPTLAAVEPTGVSGADGSPAAIPAAGPTQAPIAVDNIAGQVPDASPPASLFADSAPDPGLFAQGLHLAWTYCSTCCPAGPDECPHTSWGLGASAEQAAMTAVTYCAGSGGYEESCRANVQYVSEDELAF